MLVEMTVMPRRSRAGDSLLPALVVLACLGPFSPVLAEIREQQPTIAQMDGSTASLQGLPLGLESAELFVPKSNPMTPGKIELGRLLFFDTRLSADDSIACATCHSPAKGFSDNLRVSSGIQGRQGTRNAPTIINRVSKAQQFWDGRAASLEEQAKGPIINPLEMGMLDLAAVTGKVASIEGYRKLFQEVFGREVNIEDIARAIASFERTLVSGNSRWDQFSAGDESALTDPERRGLAVFRAKGRCNQCHSGWNLTDEKFHNIGVGWDKEPIDKGRSAVTGKERHSGAFKTPMLREIALTAPYMHDGSLGTLEEVVDYYSEGVISNPYLDPEMARPALSMQETIDLYEKSLQSGEQVSIPVKKLNLTKREKADLVAFLQALNGEGWKSVQVPNAFPE